VLRKHSRFLLLLALFFAGVAARQMVLPVMEGSDEHLHYNYVEWLRTENRLPERATYMENSMVQESGQPPLTYWLYTLPLRLLNMPSVDGLEVMAHLHAVKNRWISPHNPWNRSDNVNIYYHGPGEAAFGRPDIVAIARNMRLFSPVFGFIAVIGGYGAAREVFKRESWALTATALLALMPTMIALNAYVTNDIGVVTFTSLATWQALRILRLGSSPFRSLVLGLLLGCAALSKVSGLLVAPGAMLALLIDWRVRQRPFRELLSNGLICVGALALLFAPWVAFGVITFHDPFGTRTHYHPDFRHEPLLTIWQTIPLLPRVYRSYWGYGAAEMHPVMYLLFGILAALSVMGAVTGLGFGLPVIRRWSWIGWGRNLSVQQALVLGLMFLGVLAGLMRWLSEYLFIGGRLMYPAHVPIILGLTGGLYLLARRFPLLTRPLQLGAVGLVAVTGIITAPVRVYAAYAPPLQLEHAQLPALQGGPVDYEGIIRFLGQTQAESYIDAEDLHPVTLCWEVLQATERPAAFSLKFVHDGEIVADRTSVFGMGRFNSLLWQPGDIFCDLVEVPIDDPDLKEESQPLPGQTYDMLLVLLDAQTLDVNWKAYTPDGAYIQFPIVGQVIASDSSGS
jgi:4-amino-4-deoxy-L-arabinose transferase-like glycosyltransferase